MGKWKRYIPEGMKDTLFKECDVKINIENSLRNIYKGYGFSEVISPTLEFYDVFNSNNQPIPQEKMYKLFDSAGRILVLRPDMTMPMARIVSTKINENSYPLKLCYNCNIFRINENLNGKMSEITQSGVEIIGISNLKADVEVIITAIKALLCLGIKNFKMELGQAEFFKALVENEDFNYEELESMRKLIENKNYITLSNFLKDKKADIDDDSIKILETLPQLFGDIQVVYKAKGLTKNKKAQEALDNILDIYKIIDKVGLGKYVSIDLGMVQNIDYYTGIIFKAYVDELGESILSGGRYDNLIKEFGLDLPATGFAINVDNVMEALKRQGIIKANEEKKVLVYSKEEHLKKAYELMEKARNIKYICELSMFYDEVKSLEYGRRTGINYMISIVSDNTLNIYNLNTNEVKSIDIKDLESEL